MHFLGGIVFGNQNSDPVNSILNLYQVEKSHPELPNEFGVSGMLGAILPCNEPHKMNQFGA